MEWRHAAVPLDWVPMGWLAIQCFYAIPSSHDSNTWPIRDQMDSPRVSIERVAVQGSVISGTFGTT